MGDYLYVASNRSKLWSSSQLALQIKNPLELVEAGDPRRQVIRNNAHTTLGNHCERRLSRRDFQAVQRK